MGEGSTNEIVTVSVVWDGQPRGRIHDFSKNKDGEWRPEVDYGPWLLTFHLTDLGEGRLQCVGFEMRSYLKEQPAGDTTNATWADPSEVEMSPALSDKSAAWVSERKAKGLPTPDLQVHGWAQSKRARRLLEHIFETDREAAAVGADEKLSFPRELQAQMVKDLQFGGLLGAALREATSVRRERSVVLQAVARECATGEYVVPIDDIYEPFLREPPTLPFRDPATGAIWARVLTPDPDEQARLQRVAEWCARLAEDDARETEQADGRPPGRPRLYGPEDLRAVAISYTEFVRQGHRNPTALVAKHLGIDASKAAKRVQICRKAKWSLLPQPIGTHAVAWKPGEAPWERNTAGPSR